VWSQSSDVSAAATSAHDVFASECIEALSSTAAVNSDRVAGSSSTVDTLKDFEMLLSWLDKLMQDTHRIFALHHRSSTSDGAQARHVTGAHQAGHTSHAVRHRLVINSTVVLA